MDFQKLNLECRSLVVACVMCAQAAVSAGDVTFQEDFGANPLQRGWRIFGNTNLFRWNTNGWLEVTWDSSKPNSYFHLPLGTILSRSEDFSFALDLRLDDATSGVNPLKMSVFPLALGFQNSVDAQRPDFGRGTGRNSPNLVEFSYFPSDGVIDSTVWPIIFSREAVANYNGAGDYTIMELPNGIWMRLTFSYQSGNKSLQTTITTNGIPISAIHTVPLTAVFTDFRAETFAIPSYSDAMNTGMPGSVLAHGIIDNITLTVPGPPIENLRCVSAAGNWAASFGSRANWVYALERSVEWDTWTTASAPIAGTGSELTIEDTNSVPRAFYRIRGNRP